MKKFIIMAVLGFMLTPYGSTNIRTEYLPRRCTVYLTVRQFTPRNIMANRNCIIIKTNSHEPLHAGR